MNWAFNNSKNRKYQCFVCGVNFNTEKEFTSHITEEHELSREYILCPHCKAPIRDLRIHWKIRHNCLPFPTNCQIKAIVWREFTPEGKRKKSKKPSFREGYFESNKMKKVMHYRSGYECDVFECLESLNEIAAYDSESLKIPYIWNGEPHNYIPDIFVQFVDGRRELWEIKPANQTSDPQNQAKWASAKKFCEHMGWKFEIITEPTINQLKKRTRLLREQ